MESYRNGSSEFNELKRDISLVLRTENKIILLCKSLPVEVGGKRGHSHDAAHYCALYMYR